MKIVLSFAVLSALLPSTSALVPVIVSATTTDPCAGFDVSTCPTVDPGSPFEAGCVAGGCGEVPKPPGQTCDTEGCTYGITDGFGNCIENLPKIMSSLEISLLELGEVLYKGNPETNIPIRFLYSTYSGMAMDPMKPTFAAIFFSGSDCGKGNKIIGATTDVTPEYASDAIIPTDPAFFGTVPFMTATTPGKYFVDLHIDTPLDKFDYPFYQQDAFCTNSDLLSTERCGKLQFCVEFQVLLCGKKIDFVDVFVQIELDIEVQCESDCLDVTLERAAQVNTEGSAQADFPIVCEACFEDNNLIDGPIYQGVPIKSCIKLVDEVPGACIVEIEELDFIITKLGIPPLTSEFQIVPYDGCDNCLFSAFGGFDYEPSGAFLNRNGATAGFQPPAWMFQEVLPQSGGASLKGKFKGSVILGFGCYCDFPPTCSGGEARKLQTLSEGSLYLTSFDGAEFDMTADVLPTAEPAGACGLGALLG